MDLETLILLAGTSLAITRLIKERIVVPLAARFNMGDETRKGLIYIVSLLVGIGVVLVTEEDVSLFTDTYLAYKLPDFADVVITGIAIGLGSNFLHFIQDVFGALKNIYVKRSELP